MLILINNKPNTTSQTGQANEYSNFAALEFRHLGERNCIEEDTHTQTHGQAEEVHWIFLGILFELESRFTLKSVRQAAVRTLKKFLRGILVAELAKTEMSRFRVPFTGNTWYIYRELES